MPKKVIKTGDVLETWKEISSYLNKGVRRCQRWEKQYNLPVYRKDNSPKSRVFASKTELAEWLQNDFSRANKGKKNALDYIKLNHALKFALVILPIGLLIFLWLSIRPTDAIPADFKITDSNLIILNKKGRVLWRHSTGVQDLLDEESYRERFQQKKQTHLVEYFPYIIIKDINNDGKKEVLFNIQTNTNRKGGILLCFDHKGKELWNFVSGREIKTGNDIYSNDFQIHGIHTFDIEDDGNHEIIVISDHVQNFPTQLMILDSKGHPRGEYWNSGRLDDIEFYDLNKDGKKEMIVAAMNNEYKKGCLIVFDISNINGSSPQFEKEYKFEGIKSGSEKYYILFPRTEIDELKTQSELLIRLDILNNGNISVLSQVGRILFILNRQLMLQSVRLSDDFKLMYREIMKEGITNLVEDKLRNNLKNGFLYFNSSEWVSKPALSNPW